MYTRAKHSHDGAGRHEAVARAAMSATPSETIAARRRTAAWRSYTGPCAAAAGIALAIFGVDTFVPLTFAIAVLYVVVVMIAATTRDRGVVFATATACGALTLASWLLVHRLMLPDSATLRAAVSLAAIAITTILAVRNIDTVERLCASDRHRANLARFFSRELVDELAELDTPLSLARQGPAAVMFVDVVGFTSHAAMIAPAAVIAFLRDLQAMLSQCVFGRSGTIDKFLGDGLIAVFGLPQQGAQDTTHAALAAFDILTELEKWNAVRAAHGAPAVRLAIGIHYGPVVQGDIGSESRLELTVVGDTVNMASRVEKYCRDAAVDFLVTDAVVASLHGEGAAELALRFTNLGAHRLRGRRTPTELYGYRHPKAVITLQPGATSPRGRRVAV